MGRKVVLAVVCWLTLSEASGEPKKSVDSSVVPDNESAESAPRLYKTLPVGVYASAAPYASYSYQVPAVIRAPQARLAQQASVVLPAAGLYKDLKDSYGKYVAAPQAYKAAFQQQFVPLQDLPPHLAQPLVSRFKSAPNYFFGPHSYKVQALQFGPTPTPLTHLGSFSQPLVYAEDLKHFAPSSNFYASERPPKVSSPQTSINKAYFVNTPHHSLQEKLQAHVASIKDAKQQASHHHEKGQIEAAPAQTCVTAIVNGKKTVVTLETKPPIPLLDLDLLEPLTFDNPLVPQVQHFLPKISSATYHKLPAVNKPKEPKKKNKEIIVTKTQTYDSGDIEDKPAPPKKKYNKPKPTSKPGITVKGYPNSDDYSYEINTPNHKETYNEQVVKYNKETNMKPVEYSYNQQTHNEPEVYTYVHSSKEPLKVTHVEYNSDDDEPKHLVYTSLPEEKEEDNQDDERQPSSQESDDSGESSAESEEEGPAPHSQHHDAPAKEEEEDTASHEQYDNTPKQHEYSHHYTQNYELPKQQHSHQHTENYETTKPQHHNSPKKHHSEHHDSPKQHYSHQPSENYEKPKQPNTNHHSLQLSENYEKPKQSSINHHSDHHGSPKQVHYSNHHSEHHASPKQHDLHHYSKNHENDEHRGQHDSPRHSENHSGTHSNSQNQYHHNESPNSPSSPPPSSHSGHSEAPEIPQQHYVIHQVPTQYYTPMNFQHQGPLMPTPFHAGFQVHQSPRPAHHLPAEHRGQQYQQLPNQHQVMQSTPRYFSHTLTLDNFQPITPEYNQDVRLLPTHAPHLPHPAALKVDPNQHVQIGQTHTFNAQPSVAPHKLTQRNEKHLEVSPTPVTLVTAPSPQEKSKRVTVKEKEEISDDKHIHIEQAGGEMEKTEENNEDDFEKAYKESAFGFPAYDKAAVEAIEEDIYDPDNYGEARFENDYKVDDSPFKQFEKEGDHFPKSARLAYKDARDNNMEDYYSEYAISKPERYTDRVKNKVNYYKLFKNNRPGKSFYAVEDNDNRRDKKSEQLSSPSFDYLGTFSKPKAKQSKLFSEYKAAPIQYEYDYSNEAPKDSISYASHKRTHFAQPQFQYGFKPINAPIVVESELAASASNDHPESEKPGMRKKVYKENWFIKKTMTTASKPS